MLETLSIENALAFASIWFLGLVTGVVLVDMHYTLLAERKRRHRLEQAYQKKHYIH